jgi:Na+/H+ antiporter NhaD/arsenite permease-like protein
MSGFMVCNIASMGLYIGNPTNVIVAQAYNISFIEYTAWMGLPTLIAIVVCYLVTLALFWNRIPTEIEAPPEDTTGEYAIKDQFGAVFGCVTLVLCLVALMVTPVFADVGVWLLTLPFAVVMMVKDVVTDVLVVGKKRPAAKPHDMSCVPMSSTEHLVTASSVTSLGDQIDATNHSDFLVASKSASVVENEQIKKSSLEVLDDIREEKQAKPVVWINTQCGKVAEKLPITSTILKRLPWKLVPFSLGMFILVEALNSLGWTALLAKGLSFVSLSLVPCIFAVGLITTLSCNALNNLPMAILFSRALSHPNFVQDEIIKRASLFALIIGSNLGANVLYVGSLAGLMWSDVIKHHGMEFRQRSFFFWCVCVTPFVLVGACGILTAELIVKFGIS